MRFDLIDLRLFLAVVEAESITHGAERVALALPSASARIRGMEEDGGVPLLERNSRGVSPTPAGKALAHHARLVIGQLEQMRGDLRLYARGLRGHVRVLSVTSGLTHLPEALRRFLAAYPSIDIDLDEKPGTEVVAGIAGGLADLGIAADATDIGSLETRPFTTVPLVVILPKDHPLAVGKTLALRDVLDEPFIGLPHGNALQALLSRHAAREGRPFKLRVRLGSFEPICAMVESGVGLAIVPEPVARAYRRGGAARMLPLSDAWARRRLLICARRFDELPIHARALIDVLTETAAQVSASDRRG